MEHCRYRLIGANAHFHQSKRYHSKHVCHLGLLRCFPAKFRFYFQRKVCNKTEWRQKRRSQDVNGTILLASLEGSTCFVLHVASIID